MRLRRSLALLVLVVAACLLPGTGERDVEVRAAPPVIEDFRYDKLKTEGTAREVCPGRIGNGTLATFYEVQRRFGGTAGTMYACRERWDAANNPDCNGTVVNPAASPNFFSTCWSTHAAGRAWDLMVGRVGSGHNTSRGIAIVNWLLASDSAGNVNARARRLGVQQILFGDRCWNADGDRGIATWYAMRKCGIGHHDHVHVDMTNDGTAGNVSYWGATPRRPAPKLDTTVFWDRHSAWQQTVSWRNLRATSEGGRRVHARYDRAFVGDFDRDGIEDEIFLWDTHTGVWLVQTWTNGGSATVSTGQWHRAFDEMIVGDWDGDGRVNDMFVWNSNTGKYGIQSWSNHRPSYRGQGYWSPGYEQVIAGDFDSNGLFNDLLLWDRDNGKWAAFSWHRFQSTYQALGYLSPGYDNIIVGDWDAGGNMDETLVWDRNTGKWIILSWSHHRPTYRRVGYWSVIYDFALPGDFDTDGRVDDVFVYDTATGKWAIYSFHRYTASFRLAQDWLHGYDVISVGSFLD